MNKNEMTDLMQEMKKFHTEFEKQTSPISPVSLRETILVLEAQHNKKFFVVLKKILKNIPNYEFKPYLVEMQGEGWIKINRGGKRAGFWGVKGFTIEEAMEVMKLVNRALPERKFRIRKRFTKKVIPFELLDITPEKIYSETGNFASASMVKGL